MLIIVTTVYLYQMQPIFISLLVFSSKSLPTCFRKVSKPFCTAQFIINKLCCTYSIVYLFSINLTEFVTNILLTGPVTDKYEIFLNFNLFSINSRSIIETDNFKIHMQMVFKVLAKYQESRYSISDVELAIQNLDSRWIQ